jgi:hypothetical protein
MCGMSPNVAAPNATARTKCRRLNLPSRKPPQHAQEASRRTICNVVIVPLSAAISRYRTLVEAYPFTLILHMRGRQKCATITGDVSGIERGSITLPCAAPEHGGGAGNRYPLACPSSAPGISSQSGNDWKARLVEVAVFRWAMPTRSSGSFLVTCNPCAQNQRMQSQVQRPLLRWSPRADPKRCRA